MKNARSSRLFQPSSLHLARLEPLVLLDGSDWAGPLLTGVVTADVAIVADSKEQVAADLATLRHDIETHQHDLLSWKLDRNNLDDHVTGLRAEISQFNGEYHPKKITCKTTYEVDAAGKTVAKLVVEADFSNLIGAVFTNANTDYGNLQTTKAAINAGKVALSARQTELGKAGEVLITRLAEMLRRNALINAAEGNVMQEALDQAITLTAWDNSDIEVRDGDNCDDSVLASTDAVDDFVEEDFFNGDGMA